MGGLYICVDHFDFGGGNNPAPVKVPDTLPSALKQIKPSEKVRVKRRPASVNQAQLKASIALGDKWFDKNTHRLEALFSVRLRALSKLQGGGREVHRERTQVVQRLGKDADC
jgi:hypothetical protein